MKGERVGGGGKSMGELIEEEEDKQNFYISQGKKTSIQSVLIINNKLIDLRLLHSLNPDYEEN